MRDFYFVSGRLAEVHRFINVPLHWYEHYPSRERRELWIATSEGQEVKLVVHSKLMPARCGHQVEALLFKGGLVGLVNNSTSDQVNYARANPPLKWRWLDSALLSAVLVITFVSILMGGVIVPIVMGFVTIAWVPTTLLARLASNARARLEVDRALEQVVSISGPPPLLRRVR